MLFAATRTRFATLLWPVAFASLVSAGCASDATTADTTPTCPGELSVKINEGLFFDGCRVLTSETEPKVSLETADLLVYKRKTSGFDLWSGQVDGDTQPLKVMTEVSANKIPKVFKSLGEIGYQKPSPAAVEDAQGRFFSVGSGHGLVVKNSASKGWTKVWVKQAISSAETLIVQFETF